MNKAQATRLALAVYSKRHAQRLITEIQGLEFEALGHESRFEDIISRAYAWAEFNGTTDKATLAVHEITDEEIEEEGYADYDAMWAAEASEGQDAATGGLEDCGALTIDELLDCGPLTVEEIEEDVLSLFER